MYQVKVIVLTATVLKSSKISDDAHPFTDELSTHGGHTYSASC